MHIKKLLNVWAIEPLRAGQWYNIIFKIRDGTTWPGPVAADARTDSIRLRDDAMCDGLNRFLLYTQMLTSTVLLCCAERSATVACWMLKLLFQKRLKIRILKNKSSVLPRPLRFPDQSPWFSRFAFQVLSWCLFRAVIGQIITDRRHFRPEVGNSVRATSIPEAI